MEDNRFSTFTKHCFQISFLTESNAHVRANSSLANLRGSHLLRLLSISNVADKTRENSFSILYDFFKGNCYWKLLSVLSQPNKFRTLVVYPPFANPSVAIEPRSVHLAHVSWHQHRQWLANQFR